MHETEGSNEPHIHDAKMAVHELRHGLFLTQCLLEEALESANVYDPDHMEGLNAVAEPVPVHSMLPAALQRRAAQLAEELSNLYLDLANLPIDEESDTLTLHAVVEPEEE